MTKLLPLLLLALISCGEKKESNPRVQFHEAVSKFYYYNGRALAFDEVGAHDKALTALDTMMFFQNKVDSLNTIIQNQ